MYLSQSSRWFKLLFAVAITVVFLFKLQKWVNASAMNATPINTLHVTPNNRLHHKLQTQTNQNATIPTIHFDGFDDVSTLQINGDTYTTLDGGVTVLRLTENPGVPPWVWHDSAGSAFYATPIPLAINDQSVSFTSHFPFPISDQRLQFPHGRRRDRICYCPRTYQYSLAEILHRYKVQ